MNFKCPKCQTNRIEEIMDGAILSMEVKDVEEGGDAEYGEVIVEDGFPDRYQCLNCGWVLPITETTTPSTEELYEWLEENNML